MTEELNMKRLCMLLAVVAASFIAPQGSMAQEQPPLEILSKEDAKATFALSRAEWESNLRAAVMAGAARAMSSPTEASTMVTEQSGGMILMVRPLFQKDNLKPEALQVTVGYRSQLSRTLSDSALNDAIKLAKSQMSPEYTVIGNVSRSAGGIAIFFMIMENQKSRLRVP